MGGFPPPSSYRMQILTRSALRLLPRLEWDIEGVIPSVSLGCLWGRPETFKSFLAISMACSVSTGEDWLGQHVKQLPVLYVAAEGALDFNARIEAWEKKYAASVPDDFLAVINSV